MDENNQPAPYSRDHNEQIISSLSSGVVALNADGAIITINPAARACLGVPPHALRPGMRLRDFEAAWPLADVFDEVARTREAVSRREVLLALPGNGEREVGLSASLLEGEAPFNGAILLFTDLTEWRRLERAASANQQLAALGELTAGVVHELRNPVSVISGMAELLMRRMEADDTRRSHAKAILQEATSLERSIAQFLGFAKPFDMQPEWCAPRDLVERALQFGGRRAQTKQVRIAYESEEHLSTCYVDAEMVAQALGNILVNAVDAAPENGEVTFRAIQKGGDAVFEIADDGPGIHLNADEDLFTPFFTQKEGGTGLGLTIAQRTILAHGGRITYRNRAEGGALFEIRLPLQRATGEPPR